jgi:hypothetical protein
MAKLLLLVMLLTPAFCWAQTPPKVVYFTDQSSVRLDVTGLGVAVGTIARPFKFLNPKGTIRDRQVLLIDVFSESEQPIEWDTSFRPGYGVTMPNKTSARIWVRWGFVYDKISRSWNHLANSQVPKVP